MADTNVILKYRRPQDSWLCPECDSENTLSYSSCFVCGCGRVGTPVIVKAWTEMDERPPATAPRGKAPVKFPPGPASGPVFVDSERARSKPVFVDPDRASGKPMYEEPKSHTGAIIAWTLVIILAIVVFAALKINGVI